jgi:tryptophan halogenase
MKNACIIGTGAAGWMSCLYLSSYDDMFDNITIIGSSEIPPIGVGESNTMSIVQFNSVCNVSVSDFVKNTDAAIKYGVMYEGWGKEGTRFLHGFKNSRVFSEIYGIPVTTYFRSFKNKSPHINLHEYYGKQLYDIITKNEIILGNHESSRNWYPYSWHFDAAKYIEYISGLCKSRSNVKFVDAKVDDVIKTGDKIDHIIIDGNKKLKFDYYIVATGYNDILNDDQVHLDDVLLTDKAWVYPLKYKDKPQQFHPYTVAKTMRNGWRWITPTQSRIGTGYVFSSKFIEPDKARDEFINDVGEDIDPILVDFHPRYNKKSFHENYCTVGLANGFLEPLDAPGLTISIETLKHLRRIMTEKYANHELHHRIARSNDIMEQRYKFWAAFILCQYKTSHRNDSPFWIAHKSVEYDYYDQLIDLLDNVYCDYQDLAMFMHTMAGKDVSWSGQSTNSCEPIKCVEMNQIQTKPHQYILDEIMGKVIDQATPPKKKIKGHPALV